MKILPLAYLGSIEWWQQALQPDSIIDVGEHYIKQSCRNRTEIATANGRMSLTANVVKGASIHKRALKDMRLDYSKRWQHQHLVALRSAYRSAPYYDHFADRIVPIIERPHTHLYDLSRGVAEAIVEAAYGAGSAQRLLRFSEEYIVATEGDIDLRGELFLGPEPTLYLPSSPLSQPYYQVFSERRPFEPNCSLLDYLFCEGPNF